VIPWTAVLDEPPKLRLPISSDPHCLAALMPLAQEARKPMFKLRAADGALGGHAQAVQDCYADLRSLARRIASSAGVKIE
jgi:hypothetical protein